MTPDVVWYYVGGTERGAWREAAIDFAGATTQAKRRDLAERVRAGIVRMGYHAVLGSTTIGPPEGAPRVQDASCACPSCHALRRRS